MWQHQRGQILRSLCAASWDNHLGSRLALSDKVTYSDTSQTSHSSLHLREIPAHMHRNVPDSSVPSSKAHSSSAAQQMSRCGASGFHSPRFPLSYDISSLCVVGMGSAGFLQRLRLWCGTCSVPGSSLPPKTGVKGLKAPEKRQGPSGVWMGKARSLRHSGKHVLPNASALGLDPKDTLPCNALKHLWSA